MPRQVGRLAVVTGATEPLGYAMALGLAQIGADVILTGENEIEGRDALAQIRPLAPAAVVRFEKLDLASLASVSAFAARMLSADRTIDILINAGTSGMGSTGEAWATPAAPSGSNEGAVPDGRRVTADGFEAQLGASYLAHFALTAQLLPLLRRSRFPRVVQMSCLSYRRGDIHFDDLQLERSFDAWKAFCQSKLAMLIFALELQRRSDAHGWGLLSAAAHPGFARIDLRANGLESNRMVSWFHRAFGPLVGQSFAAGALPALYAASAPLVQRGGFYGPAGPMEFAGPPSLARVTRKAQDPETASRLWAAAEELTQVVWPAE